MTCVKREPPDSFCEPTTTGVLGTYLANSFGQKNYTPLTALFIGRVARISFRDGVLAGVADYLWHRRTRIETTTRTEESLPRALMITEMAPAALSALFGRSTPEYLRSIIGPYLAHEATVAWDIYFANGTCSLVKLRTNIQDTVKILTRRIT